MCVFLRGWGGGRDAKSVVRLSTATFGIHAKNGVHCCILGTSLIGINAKNGAVKYICCLHFCNGIVHLNTDIFCKDKMHLSIGIFVKKNVRHKSMTFFCGIVYCDLMQT